MALGRGGRLVRPCANDRFEHAKRPSTWLLSVVALVVLGAGSTGCSDTASPGGRAASSSSSPATSDMVSGRPSAGCTAPSNAIAVTNGIGTLTVEGQPRTFDLGVPATATSNHPSPLILVFHGFAATAASIEKLTGLVTKGAAGGSFVVAPDGAGMNWQQDPHGSDAAFVDALVDRLLSSACIDLDRISAAGFSAGAAFALFYSCAREERIAAVATVEVEFQLGCASPIPILAFHGTDDPAVPFVDGAIGLSLPGIKVRGTELNMGDWAKLDGCAVVPISEMIGSEVTKETWPSCSSGTDVVLYRIEGGGHTWPGADPASGFGLTTLQITATDQIIAFFAAHSKH